MDRAEELGIVPEGLEEFGRYDSNTLEFVNNFSSYLQDLLPDYNVDRKYEGFGNNQLDIILEVTDEEDNTMPNWPSRRFWSSIEDDETFDEAWSTYLAGPEDEVNKELQIFPEPSVQGGMGGLFVFDESGEDRKDEDEDWYVDWQDYNYWQLKAAASSKSAEEYKNKYRKYMKDLCGI